MITKIYDKFKIFIKDYYKFLILLIVLNFLFWFKLPYVVYAPGGLISLENKVVVDENYKSEGTFNMAYVTVVEGNIPTVLASYLIPNWDLLKIKDVTSENETYEEMIVADKLYYKESITNAKIAAYNSAGARLVINNRENRITYIDMIANDVSLEIGDTLVSADDVPIYSLTDYKSVIESHNFGDKIKLIIKRENKELEKTIEVKDLKGEKKTGLAFATIYDVDTIPDVEVKMKDSESGPSGGLMLALSIYDKLTPFDLTKGLKIVGTGTIDADGNVGEIGGVKYKVLGAIKNKADIFLTPEENYEEAKKVLDENNSKIKLISVKTLSEAIYALS